MTQEALKLALEALISCELSNYGRDWVWPVTAHEQAMKNVKEAITAIKEALAQTQEPVVGTKTWFEDGKVITQHLTAKDIYKEQEPVALQYPQKDIDWQREQQIKAQASTPPQGIYYTPQQRTWVGLTSEDWNEIFDNALNKVEAIKLTKDKLKEKNT